MTDSGADSKPEKARNESPEKPVSISEHVASRMREGMDQKRISLELAGTGMDQREAERLVDSTYREIVNKVLAEQVTSSAFQRGILGGLLASVAGGCVWAALSIVTGYEIGVMAWGVGYLAGYAVVLASGGSKGTQLQVTAAASALFGILIARYVSFTYYFTDGMADGWDYGVFFAPETMEAFFEALPEMGIGFSLFWIFLAVTSAWKIPKGLGIDLPPQYRPPYVVG